MQKEYRIPCGAKFLRFFRRSAKKGFPQLKNLLHCRYRYAVQNLRYTKLIKIVPVEFKNVLICFLNPLERDFLKIAKINS